MLCIYIKIIDKKSYYFNLDQFLSQKKKKNKDTVYILEKIY